MIFWKGTKHLKRKRNKLRSDEELKQLYTQYLFRFASMYPTYSPDRDGVSERDMANQLLGVAFAYGRMLGLGMSRIRLDVKRATTKAEEQALPSGGKKISHLL